MKNQVNNPKKFLDTRLLLENNIMKTAVYRKANKFSVCGNCKFQEDTKEMH